MKVTIGRNRRSQGHLRDGRASLVRPNGSRGTPRADERRHWSPAIACRGRSRRTEWHWEHGSRPMGSLMASRSETDRGSSRARFVDLHGEKDAELLKWFPLSHTHAYEYRGSGRESRSFIKVIDLPAFFKERPSLDESPSYLLGWLAGYFAADGCVAKDGTVMLNSASKDDLEFVHLLCSRHRHRYLRHHRATSQRLRLIARNRASIGSTSSTRISTTSSSSSLEHRLRFAGSQKQWTRRGWVVQGSRTNRSCRRSVLRDRPGRRTRSPSKTTSSPGTASVARRVVTRSRSCARSSTSTSSTRSSGSRRARTSPSATTTRRSAKDKGRKARLHEAVAAAIEFYEQLAARRARGRARPALPAGPGLRRRRGAPLPARLVARRLGSPEHPPAAAEVQPRRPHRRRPRVREQGEQAPGPVPGPADVPDLRQPRRAGRLRRPHARRRGPEVQELAGDAASTRRAGCSTG